MRLRDRLAARFGNRAVEKVGDRKTAESVWVEDPASSPKPRYTPSRDELDNLAQLRADAEREQQSLEAERLRREEAGQEAERSRRKVQELRRQWDRERVAMEADSPVKKNEYEPPADW